MTDDTRGDAPNHDREGEPRERRTKKKKKVKVGGAVSAKASSRGGVAPANGQSESLGRRALLVALATLIVGVGIGWLVRGNQTATAKAEPAAAAAPAGSAGADAHCAKWTAAICKEAGDSAEACGQSRAAAKLLPDVACQAALPEVSQTLAKVKTARSVCDELVAKLCADLGDKSESCKLVQERTPSFPTEQCQQMMTEYDQVLAELRKMDQQNAPLSAEAVAAQRAGDGPSFGPADAKVTVVEYSDFECPFCSRGASVLQQLKKKYADRVRIVFRQYPLPMHQNASLAAEASLAAHAQGKFWELHDKMFENQRALDRASIERYAKELGLNMTPFKAALDNHTYQAAVKADMLLGEQIGVNGTPTMIVNAKRVPNPTDFAAVAALVESELAAAN